MRNRNKALKVNRPGFLKVFYQRALFALCLFALNSNAIAKNAIEGNSLIDSLMALADQYSVQLVMDGVTQDILIKTPDSSLPIDQYLTQLLINTPYQHTLTTNRRVVVITKRNKTEQVDKKENKTSGFERILVTGQAFRNRSLLDSAISVTHINSKVVKQKLHQPVANLLSTVPGFWIESSGGEVNNNVAPRGLRGGEGYRFISLMEDGLPVVYDGVWSDFFLRHDIMTERVETVRGGTSGILTTNGPAAMVNFINTQGQSDRSHLVLNTGLNNSYWRLDGVAEGESKLLSGWHYAVGGFVRESRGIRDPGYTGNMGGQVKANLSNTYDNSKTYFSFKYLNDKTSFYGPTPMKGAGKPEGVASVSATQGTLLSKDFADLIYKYPEGNIPVDITNGQQTELLSLGVNYDVDVSDDFRFSNKMRYSSISNSMLTVMNLSDTTVINSQALKTKLADQYQAPEDQFKIYQSANKQAIDDDSFVATLYPLYAQYQQNQLINHLSVNIEADDFQLTVGHMLSINNYDQLPFDKWLGEILVKLENQPKLVDIELLTEQGEQIVLTESGYTSFEGPAYIDGSGNSRSSSLYANLSYNPIRPLHIDFGVRREYLKLDSIVESDQVQNLVESSLTSRYSSDYHYSKKQSFSESAWTFGVNYILNKHASVYLNVASAFEMPKLLNYGNSIGWGDYVEQVPSRIDYGEPVNLFFYEVGARFSNQNWQLAATLFSTKFDPLAFTVFKGTSNDQGEIFINTKTVGVELDLNFDWHKYFNTKLVGVVQNGKFYGIPPELEESQYNSNQITRTPNVQMTLIQGARFDDFDTELAISYVGSRYSDVANNFKLPFYINVDLNANYQVNKQMSISLSVSNLLDDVGLTEGNPRAGVSQDASSIYFARSIFGRTANLSLQYQF